MTSLEAYKFSVLVLAIWREARGEPFEAKLGVANVIRNRVNSSKFKQWGLGWDGVVLQPWQFSSFNPPKRDPSGKVISIDSNAYQIPLANDPAMADCIKAAEMVFNGNGLDNTNGACYYFDKSMDKNMPAWALDGSHVRTADIGSFHFYKGA